MGGTSRILFLVVLVGLAQSPYRHAAADNHVDQSERFIAELASAAFGKLTSEISQAEKRAAIREELRDALAVKAIGKFSLGRYWAGLSVEQQQDYLRLFEDFVLRGSVDRMMRYTGQLLEIQDGSTGLGQRGDAELAIVSSHFYYPIDSDRLRVIEMAAYDGQLRVTALPQTGRSILYFQKLTSVAHHPIH